MTDSGRTLFWKGVFVDRSLVALLHGIVLLSRIKLVVNRTFDWLVVFRERSIGEGSKRGKDPPDAFRIHNERAHMILGLGVDLEVRHVVAHPFLRAFVPPDLATRWIPGLAVGIARCAIVKHAAICRPGPTPSRMQSEIRRIRWITAGGLIARFGK